MRKYQQNEKTLPEEKILAGEKIPIRGKRPAE
jgi:hypothetical protein